MRKIIFRPLRLLKNKKICVASYMSWRKVKTADYNIFELIINDEYKKYSNNEFVYNHNGELLFYYKVMPEDLSFYDLDEIIDLDEKLNFIRSTHRMENNFAFKHESGNRYISKGLDCDGVPIFSHFTADYIGRTNLNPHDFEPLTVNVVKKWFGWFLWELKNSKLQIGK